MYGMGIKGKASRQITFLLLLFLFGLPSVQAKQVTVTGEGISRDEAINDALRRAVEQVLGTMVESETLVENFQIVVDRIYTKAQGYVTSYREFDAERRVMDGIVIVKIEAIVNTRPLISDAGEIFEGLGERMGDPRITVVISEKRRDRKLNACSYNSAGEIAIIRKLQDAGFSNIMDRAQIDIIRDNNNQIALFNGDRATANAIKTRYDVDYIIVGEAFSEFLGNSGKFVSCSAVMEARFIQTDTGRIGAIENISLERPVANISEATAAQIALRNVGDRMGDHFISELQRSAQNVQRSINLTVTGIPDFSRVTELIVNLNGIRGVNDVRSRGFSGGVAEIEIRATVLAITLAGKISGMSGLEVTELSNSAIRAAMR